MSGKRHPLMTLAIAMLLTTSSAAFANERAEEGQWNQLSEEVRADLERLSDYSAERRDEAVALGQDVMNTLDSEYNQLKKQASQNWDQLSESSRATLRTQMKAIDRQRAELSAQMQDWKSGSDEAWQHLKRGLVKSYANMSDALQDAGRSLSQDDASAE